MPLTVVVGGQFGSEGKGKVAYALAKSLKATAAVRVGGSNSGHTAMHLGVVHKLRVLPTAALMPEVDVVLPAGSYLSLDLLFTEIAAVGLEADRLYIDPNAVIITESLIHAEHQNQQLTNISSTLSGTGEAVVARITRGQPLLARDVPDLKQFLADTTAVLRTHLDRGCRVILEGTQGFGLSVYHSPYYPYVTSRDTTAAGFLSEAGLSPRDVDHLVLVLRTFPIRVGGPSGPLPREITWEEVTRVAGSPDLLAEYTTVTNKLRRVARFDPEIPNRAITVNQPTHVVLNHVDYFGFDCQRLGVMTAQASRSVNDIAVSLTAPITHIGLGPDHLLSIAP